MRVRVEVAGDREVSRSLQRLGGAAVPVAKRVLGAFTKRVVPMAKAICPVDDVDGGQMRDTIRETRPTVTAGSRVSAGVLAGGKRIGGVFVDYAEQQHEDLTLKHRVGQGKFVEIPFFREVVKVPEEMLAEIDREAARA